MTPAVAPAATVVPDDTIVVDRSGVSQSAIAVMVLFGLVALVAVGLLMYQWGRTDDANDDLARARAERSAESRPADTRPATTPVPTTSPAQAPIVVPPATTPPITVNVPPAPATAPAGKTSQAGCAAYTAQLDPLLEAWEQELTTAESATGADFTASIDRLQQIERKVSHVNAPACAGRAQGHLLTAMTSMIDALKTSAAHGEPAATSTAFQQAEDLFQQFQAEYDGLKAV